MAVSEEKKSPEAEFKGLLMDAADRWGWERVMTWVQQASQEQAASRVTGSLQEREQAEYDRLAGERYERMLTWQGRRR